MPKATASSEGQKFELKTLPEGYVVLRKLSYGELLTRRNIGMNMSAPFKRDAEQVDFSFLMDTRETRYFEFEHMVLEHNLEDENGTQLNMKVRGDVDRLDPRVAQEIEDYIRILNEPDEEPPLPAKYGSLLGTTNQSAPESPKSSTS